MQRKITTTRIIEYACVLLLTAIIFLPIIHSEIYVASVGESDYSYHTQWARSSLEAPQEVPKYILIHSAWQWAVVGTHLILGRSWQAAALVVTLGSIFLTVGILFWLFRKKLSSFLSGVLAIGLVVVTPLAFLYPLDQRLYLGYIGTTIYHNPTLILLKPFAILQLIISVEAIQGKNSGWKGILAAALVSSVAVFAKPSYVLCLLPGLGILTLLRIWQKKPIDWKRIIIGIILPSIAFLVWQFIFTYGSNEESTLILAPFSVMRSYSSWLPIKFILSIVFPLVLTGVYWKEAIKDTRIQLGWLGFGIGVVLTYFFAESGVRLPHGNFTWSGIISLFILFVCCALFLVEKRLPAKKRVSRWLILASGALHLIFGVIYYLVVLFTRQYS